MSRWSPTGNQNEYPHILYIVLPPWLKFRFELYHELKKMLTKIRSVKNYTVNLSKFIKIVISFYINFQFTFTLTKKMDTEVKSLFNRSMSLCKIGNKIEGNFVLKFLFGDLVHLTQKYKCPLEPVKHQLCGLKCFY